MDLQTVKIAEIESGIFKISINRPEKLNALNTQVVQDLYQAVRCCDDAPLCRVIILTGEGDRSFIAGADLDAYSKMGPMEVREEYHDYYLRLLDALDDCSKPVIGAIKGYTFGGGNIVAMHCDVVFATEDSKFGQQEIGVGLIGGVNRLIYLVGYRAAMDILLTNKILKAPQAQEIGLINKCLPREEFDAFVLEYARNLRAHPPLTLKLFRIAKKMHEKAPLQVASQYEFELINLLSSTQGTHDKLDSFLEKRPVVHEGKKYWP